MKIVRYKVVMAEPRGLYSATAPTSYRVEYRLGEWAAAPVGGLLVFGSEPSATSFALQLMESCYPVEVYKAECEDMVPLPECRAFDPADTDTVYKVWHGGEVVDFGLWPEGTEAYRRVRLLERVRFDWSRALLNRGVEQAGATLPMSTYVDTVNETAAPPVVVYSRGKVVRMTTQDADSFNASDEES